MEFVEVLAFLADHIDIRHVLVLNLVGWMLKCILCHADLADYTDVIPICLAFIGVFMALLMPVPPSGGFIMHGLANSSVAWMLHQIVKAAPKSAKKSAKEGFDTITRPLRTLTDDDKKK